MICNYFVQDNARGILAKSGYQLTAFRKESEAQGFTLIEACDVTNETAKILNLAKSLAERILRGVEIYSEKPRKNHPFLTRILFRLFRKKWKKKNRDRVLIDSEAFKAQKRYLFHLYQCTER